MYSTPFYFQFRLVFSPRYIDGLHLNRAFLHSKALLALKTPSIAPLRLNHEKRDHREGNASQQDKCELSSDTVNNRWNSCNTSSTNQTSHQIIDCRCTSTSTGVQVDDEGAVNGKDSGRTIGNDELQNNWDCNVCAKGHSVDSDADNEDSSDPPSVAHAGVLDGEIGVAFQVNASVDGKVVLLTVFTFCSLVVEVH